LKRLPLDQVGSLADEHVRTAIEHISERMAHDFNNIITPLIAYPDMLASMVPDERAVKIIRAMQSAAESALEVTQRLAALAGGALHPASRFELCAVASAAVEEVRRQLNEVQGLEIQFACKETCWVTMQQEAFVWALEALLENAIRAACHGDTGGKVSVAVERGATHGLTGAGGEMIPDGAYNVVYVSDTGPGMEADELAHIIEPFVTGTVRSPGCGAGLGLSVAYCSLRRNGAYLQFESTPGSGTRAAMYLPLDEHDGNASVVRPVAPSKGLKPARPVVSPLAAAVLENNQEPLPGHPVRDLSPPGRHVLLVDDETSIVNLFEMILDSFIPGLQIGKAHNGADAVAAVKQAQPDVMVMDLHMPVMDGQTAFAEIARHCKDHAVPMPAVIFCTGYAPNSSLLKAVEADKRHLILNKPVPSEVLVRAVRERLGAGVAR
jgi:CheY-like chemotaxis protein/nitrogen-specific signal transduction histidine kinase